MIGKGFMEAEMPYGLKAIAVQNKVLKKLEKRTGDELE